MIRAKFKCDSVNVSNENENISLSAVTEGSIENEQWSKYTPGGHLTITISNPEAQGKIEVGKEYYLDITLAE